MPSSYLFLSQKNRDGLTWNNLPTLSQSTRECYLTVIECNAFVDDAVAISNTLIIKMKIPSLNYFSSDNEDVTVAVLYERGNNSFNLERDNPISILTNDNLKSATFAAFDEDCEVYSGVVSLNVVLKLDYIDQQAMANQVVVEYPKRL